jgi:BirA family biotin operon repressor/biotin-[acetyl-CoA-carboxylase] ligase
MRRNRDSVRSDRERFEEALRTRRLGRTLRWRQEIASTNDAARKWADAGAPAGALVFANHQSRGRGRHGRDWVVEPGLNLTVSLVLRPVISPSRFGLVTLAAGLAVREAIEACCGAGARIKWPNDILIEERKCCGMLLESAIGRVPEESFIVLGIGVNVNQDTFPEPFERSTTSVMLGCGRPIDRVLLLADILNRLETKLDRLESSPDAIVREYEGAIEGIGEAFRLTDVASGDVHTGVMRGIDSSGGLVLEIGSRRHVFHAGDVEKVVRAG